MSFNNGRPKRFLCKRCNENWVETTSRTRKYCDECQQETGSTKALRKTAQSCTGRYMSKQVKWVPVTPAGSMLFHLAAHNAPDAWKNLLIDAAHMPYKGVEGFKQRGYTVERVSA